MGDALLCLHGCFPKDRREEDGRERDGTEVCARACVSKADARVRERSRCADQEENEIDRSNQIHERRVEEDRMRWFQGETRATEREEMEQVEAEGKMTLFPPMSELWIQKGSCKVGSSLLFEWIKNESRTQMRVLQHMKRDDETEEEIRTLIDDPKEIHKVIAKAWQADMAIL